MPSIYKVLGQSNPSAATPTTLYTVPSANSTIVSTVNVCNQTNSPASYRIAVRPAGASLVSQHYIAYDSQVSGNDSISLTLGMTLSNTDVITVQANTATVSFTAFGTEIY